MFIYVKKVNPTATIPAKATSTDAGFDLYSTEGYSLKPFERKLFKTGISLEIPPGFYGRVAPRSGLAYKNGLDVMAGVIDSGFRGEVGVILINLGDKEVSISQGDRIAQIIIEACHDAKMIEVDALDTSSRGENGFGSSGSK